MHNKIEIINSLLNLPQNFHKIYKNSLKTVKFTQNSCKICKKFYRFLLSLQLNFATFECSIFG
jgi:hypothetical protein